MKKIKKLIFIIFLMCINIKTSYAAIKVIPSETYIGVGYSQNLRVANAGTNNISWTSANLGVAKVTDGKIVGVNRGETYIKVTDGVTVALCKVMVIDNFVPVQSIKLNQNGVTLFLNDKIKINPVVYPINASNKNPSYISSNTEIATVDSNGYVTAKKVGEANISVSIEDKVAIYKVTVVNKVLLDGISVQSSMQLRTNGTAQLVVNYSPANASDKNVSYRSSNNNVVTVSDTGLLRANSPGTAVITVISNDGGHVATSNIMVIANTNNTTQNSGTTSSVTTTTSSVNSSSSHSSSSSTNIKLSGISFNKTSLTLNVNEESTLSVIYNPNNATNKSVIWKSSNSGVVSVSSNGKLKGITTGVATITATANDGGYVASCVVTVTKESSSSSSSGSTSDDKRLKKIKLSKSRIDIKKGSETNLEVEFTPSDASNKNVTWYSTNEDVATVKNGKIKALSSGSTTIRVTSDDGYLQDKCEVVVYSDLPIEAISFEHDSQTVYVGYTITLKTIAVPDNTLLENPIWTSSNENVAIVEGGVVTAIDEGSAIITVSDAKNEVTASTTIEVIEKPLPKLSITVEGYDLKFDPEVKNYTLKIGSESSLNITTNYDPKDVSIAGNRDLKNSSIITITVPGSNDTKVTYVINIKKKGFNIIYFIGIISVLLVVNLIRIIINSMKKKKR